MLSHLLLTTFLVSVSFASDDWIQKNGKQYSVYTTSTMHSFKSAKRLCAYYGAILPEPKNEDENNFLSNLDSEFFYLGMTYNETEEKWVWDSDGLEVNWLNWAKWEHVVFNRTQEKNCSLMLRNSLTFTPGHNASSWDYTRCDFRLNTVICQKCVDQKKIGSNCEDPCSCVNCNNTDGSCTCNAGYNGNNCEMDINECTEESSACSTDEICENTAGSFVCKCHVGFHRSQANVCQALGEDLTLQAEMYLETNFKEESRVKISREAERQLREILKTDAAFDNVVVTDVRAGSETTTIVFISIFLNEPKSQAVESRMNTITAIKFLSIDGDTYIVTEVLFVQKPTEDDDDGVPLTVVLGCVIGGVVVLAIIAYVVFKLSRRQKKEPPNVHVTVHDQRYEGNVHSVSSGENMAPNQMTADHKNVYVDFKTLSK